MKRKTGEMAQTEYPFTKSVKNPRGSRAHRLEAAFGILISTALLVGCGGGGGGGSSNNPSPSPSLLSGTFVDSAVQGLSYETETQSGVTDMNGTFKYKAGETVTFYVGDVMLGGAMAKSMMTPVDLVDGAVNENNPMVTNMARFLQTLDSDINPGNGITITHEMATAMVGHMVDFNMGADAFGHSPDMLSVMNTINMMDSSGTVHMMVSIRDAQTHLGNTMSGMMNGNSGMMNSGGTTPSGDGTIPVHSDLMTGTFVDSAVQGLSYETETRSGVTDMNGTFMYLPGETVTFYVGDVMLGGAMAKSMMTPVDLVDGAVNETNPMVTNMARFLQTLDSDRNPENGITITQEMADAMIGHMVDFDMGTDAFGHSSDIQDFMNAINMMDSSGTGRMMVSIEDAQNHLRNTMVGMMNGNSGMTNNSNNGSGMMNGDNMTGNLSGSGMTPGNQTIIPGSNIGMLTPGNEMMN